MKTRDYCVQCIWSTICSAVCVFDGQWNICISTTKNLSLLTYDFIKAEHHLCCADCQNYMWYRVIYVCAGITNCFQLPSIHCAALYSNFAENRKLFFKTMWLLQTCKLFYLPVFYFFLDRDCFHSSLAHRIFVSVYLFIFHFPLCGRFCWLSPAFKCYVIISCRILHVGITSAYLSCMLFVLLMMMMIYIVARTALPPELQHAGDYFVGLRQVANFPPEHRHVVDLGKWIFTVAHKCQRPENPQHDNLKLLCCENHNTTDFFTVVLWDFRQHNKMELLCCRHTHNTTEMDAIQRKFCFFLFIFIAL